MAINSADDCDISSQYRRAIIRLRKAGRLNLDTANQAVSAIQGRELRRLASGPKPVALVDSIVLRAITVGYRAGVISGIQIGELPDRIGN